MTTRALLSALMLAAGLAVAPTAAANNQPPPAPKVELDPGAKRITGSDNYVPTFGLRASITRGFQVHGVLAVDAGLDIPDAKLRKKVEGVRPRLISSMREAVLNYASLSYIIGEKPDADIIRIRL